jgi:hypothetical protein
VSGFDCAEDWREDAQQAKCLMNACQNDTRMEREIKKIHHLPYFIGDYPFSIKGQMCFMSEIERKALV